MNRDELYQKAIEAHRQLGGKIEVVSKDRVDSAEKLSLYYTPGVAGVSSYLAQNPDELRNLSIKGNTVAIVSDGSAVLGLGNIGPAGAIPVMEGKAMLFKELAGVNAFPIVLDTQDTEQIISTVKAIAPIFGGINLEDISAPRCFEIEQRLASELDIPVMHDDQHGTAIVVLAGLINAAKVTRRDLKNTKVVIIGAGAAGTATAMLLLAYGVTDIVVVDSVGVIVLGRADLNDEKVELAKVTNPHKVSGDLSDALTGADIVIGVSRGHITPDQVKSMAADPIVFALANPDPEITPDVAKAAGAAVVATGRSDMPNQVNNALGFPGIFKGALEHHVESITPQMKLKAAEALASVVKNPTADEIIPSVFDPAVVPAIASAIK